MPQQHLAHAVVLDPGDSERRIHFGRVVVGQNAVTLDPPRGHDDENAERRIRDGKARRLYATGNNLTIADDMTARTLLCSLDANCEHPGERHFDFDVVEEIHGRREQLVVAALTVLLAWHRTGASLQITPMGGFEDWSWRVREPLIWLGQADPCDSIVAVHARDPSRSEFEAVVQNWEPRLRAGGKTEYTVQEIINAGLIDSNLHAALMAVAATRSGPMVSSERLGRWLRKNEGKIHGGLKLVCAGNHHGYLLWTLKRS